MIGCNCKHDVFRFSAAEKQENDFKSAEQVGTRVSVRFKGVNATETD